MGCVFGKQISSSGISSGELAREKKAEDTDLAVSSGRREKLGAVSSGGGDGETGSGVQVQNGGNHKEEEEKDGNGRIRVERRRSRPNPRLSNPPKHIHGEQVAAGWPSWLSAVAGEAINGWTPRRADTFEKIDKIGQGTYSNVYKARDALNGRIVALKKVRFDNLEPESVRFMAREILILRRLDHPNVVKLFLRFHINNVGDPFTSSNLAMDSRKFEVEVLDWFAKLWEIENDEYWGYVTNGGTEGNFHGLLLGREMFPSGILYTSTESHYSIFKIARILRMECVVVETSVTGKIDIADLKTKLLLNTGKPAIINVNIGTTFKGALDDLDLIIETLNKCGLTEDQFYIHCDAALSGILVPFLKYGMKISFKKPIGSITISGHKFLGCPMPCGVQMTRKKHINTLSKNIDYINTIDATISGSRNGHSPIFLWYILNHKGHSGIKRDVINCLRNAHYLANRLRKVGISTMLNESSITVVFERPHDPDFICKWQLACVNNLAHIVILPNITVEIIDEFCDDLLKTRKVWYANKNFTTLCVAADIGDNNCYCVCHKVRLQLDK